MTSLLTLDETAALLHMSPNTLRFWRQEGRGPQGFRIGRRVMYDRAEVEAWIEQQRRAALAVGR